MKQPFKLDNIEDVKQFVENLNHYQTSTYGFILPYIDLVTAYENLQCNKEGGRIFSALLDLKINYISLNVDLDILQRQNNELIMGQNGEASLLSNPLFFYRKFEIHRSLANFIPKYRALWDKIMGILILIYSPENYNRYSQAKSRKREFVKLCENIPQIPNNFSIKVVENLEKFDNQFRTPEVHGTGTIRKWSFTIEKMADTDLLEVILYSNWLIPNLEAIDKVFKN